MCSIKPDYLHILKQEKTNSSRKDQKQEKAGKE